MLTRAPGSTSTTSTRTYILSFQSFSAGRPVLRRARPWPPCAVSRAHAQSSAAGQCRAATAGGPAEAGCHTAASARTGLAAFLSRWAWLRHSAATPVQLVTLGQELAAAEAPAGSQPLGSTQLQSQPLLHGSSPHMDAQVETAEAVAGTNQENRIDPGSAGYAPAGAGCGGDGMGMQVMVRPGAVAGYAEGSGQQLPAGCKHGTAGFFILRDDLLHPVLGGNKVRKLDALLPHLVQQGATDLVTCGGLQSAHTAAVAVASAELGLGLRSHLLVRGEPPKVPTGYHLVARMYGTTVSYVTRAEYADRGRMFGKRVEALRRTLPPEAQVAVVPEGGADPRALLGLVRVVQWLADPGAQGPEAGAGAGADPGVNAAQCGVLRTLPGLPQPTTTPYTLVVDSGTGTTAIGLALGVWLLGLPWRVVGIMLAGDLPYYTAQQDSLTRAFFDAYGRDLDLDPGLGGALDSSQGGQKAEGEQAVGGSGVSGEAGAQHPPALPTLPLEWVPRVTPRRFGSVLPGEVAACKQVAQRYGISLDPIYSLAAWEWACREATAAAAAAAAATAAAASADTEETAPRTGAPPPAAPGTTSIPGAASHAGAAYGASGTGCGQVAMGTEVPSSHEVSATLGRPAGHLVVLHGGGALGLYGLAQRYPEDF